MDFNLTDEIGGLFMWRVWKWTIKSKIKNGEYVESWKCFRDTLHPVQGEDRIRKAASMHIYGLRLASQKTWAFLMSAIRVKESNIWNVGESAMEGVSPKQGSWAF